MRSQTITSSRPTTIPSPPLFVAFVLILAVLMFAAMLSRSPVGPDGDGSADIVMNGP